MAGDSPALAPTVAPPVSNRLVQVLASIPDSPCNVPMWAVDMSAVRHELSEQHSTIIQKLLLQHARRARNLALYIDRR